LNACAATSRIRFRVSAVSAFDFFILLLLPNARQAVCRSESQWDISILAKLDDECFLKNSATPSSSMTSRSLSDR
jgi:hypothetical protein